MSIGSTSKHTLDPPSRRQIRAKPLARSLAALLIAVALISSSAAVSGAASSLIHRGSSADKRIALTFDVEGNAGLSSLLQTLKAHNIKGTFFVLGLTAEQYPSVVPAIQAGGHEIANHTYGHQNYTQLSRTAIMNDLKRAEQIIARQMGNSNLKRYFRPPFGEYNAAVLDAVGAAGYPRTILWDVDTKDWAGISADSVRSRVLQDARNGSIILFHVMASSNTPQALPRIISDLKARGHTFGTVSELLGVNSQPAPPAKPPAASGTHVVTRGESWWSISQKYGVNMSELARVNGKQTTDTLYVGQSLTLPAKPGQTPAPTPKPTPAPTPRPTPAPTPGPAPAPAPPAQSRHTVRLGETWWSLSRLYNVGMDALAAANGKTITQHIYVGERLIVPGRSVPVPTVPVPPPSQPAAVTYTVKAGDTLYAIASRHGVTLQAIVNANNISNPNLIRVGQVFRIPR